MIGHSLGSSLGGMLFAEFGFLISFLFCIMILLTALASSTLLVRDYKTENEDDNKSISFFRDFFNIIHFQKSVKTCFNKGPNKRRIKVIIFLSLLFIVAGPSHAENSVNYMFTRFSFGWNTVQYGLFTASKFSMELIGTFITLTIVIKFFRCDESLLGMFGVVSSMAANSIYASAPSPGYFYSGVFFGLFTPLPYMAVRSLIAKTIPAHEQAQSNSVFGICDAITPLIFGPLYTTIYKYTIDIFPGTYLVVTIFLKSIGFCFFIFLYYQSRRESRTENKDLNNDCHSLN
ncbi:hypothetical protein WA026_013208 [Henosepilachna vigintioctopunctata]|uniref:Uncharacterized protein n=1 Tax=Henosepilachna vigintioctopunctata TaxID=420089 RepID=A0AAW1ULF4_9CUCU